MELAILEKEVWVTINGTTIAYFESLGYAIPKYTDKQGRLKIKNRTKILVKVTDLPSGSGAKVTKICDVCEEHVPNKTYGQIITSRKQGDGKDRCVSCGAEYRGLKIRNNPKPEKTLDYWAKTNNKEYLLNEFSVKNDKRPNQIAKSTKDEYLWNCPDCKSEYLTGVNSRTNMGSGCPYCTGQKVNHTNCLWTTHPEIAKLLFNPQRGYEINYGSEKNEEFMCHRCERVSKKQINKVVNYGFSCSKCGDGVSYPEKFMFNLLDQLNIKFETQKSNFKWSKNIIHQNEKLSGDKIYDFYIPNTNCIIETHGGTHFKEGYGKIGSRTLNEEKENDRLKKRLASENGIAFYIEVDCRLSDLNYIKQSVLKSKLNNLFDLSNIDWSKCHEFACGTRIKEVCDMWNNGITNTSRISSIMKISKGTVRNYLKKGAELKWCEYDASKITIKNVVQLSDNNNFIKEWYSMTDAEKHTGIKIANISQVCGRAKKTAGGFKWMYKEDYDQYISQAN